MPDSYKCWVTLTNTGYWPTAVQTNSFQFVVDQIVDPFNATGGTGKTIPNPLVSASGVSPSGVRNLLYNTVTSTGIYKNYRVWRVKLRFEVAPQLNGDASTIAMAPVIGAAGAYAGINQICQAPNSVSKMAVVGTPNVLTANWSIPELLGIKESDYATTSTASTYATSGTILPQVGYNAVDGNLANALPFFIKIQQFVEFFSRSDYNLLQT